MNTKLGAEERRKVAEAVTGNKCVISHGSEGTYFIYMEVYAHRVWAPEDYDEQYRALVRTVAQMIVARDANDTAPHYGLWHSFGQALATNNVPEIEWMAYELLENKE